MSEGNEIRTRADFRPTELESAALDRSAIPPFVLSYCAILILMCLFIPL